MIIVDFKDIESKKDFYDLLNEKFDFEYEANNLDGLFDLLSMEDERIVLKNYGKIYESLGDYGETALSCFMKASITFDLDIDFYKFS